MKLGSDPVLLLLVFVLLASLSAFALGLLVYPFGLLVLVIAIAARILYLQSDAGGRR